MSAGQPWPSCTLCGTEGTEREAGFIVIPGAGTGGDSIMSCEDHIGESVIDVMTRDCPGLVTVRELAA